MVRVPFTSKDVFFCDLFAVSKTVKDEWGKVESVRVTRSGDADFVCAKSAECSVAQQDVDV